ncbi:sensor histidine kinase [Jiella marina]|uniref:sensor histidine kinase n=1 Tax=Jiella sp. LLJ827 TaxID=2917712 RepID=UPI002101BFDB|nr:HAMP domain-containing sensor histidine kinase [Jiella sp. LLJ827]MCQ0987909.1 HAMP domain-containing histidine kinase [Jiella sp. LLJ827]
MSLADPPIFNQSLVARRTASVRDSDLRKTIRETRERLSFKGQVAPRFTRELLSQHAVALKSAAIIVPLPVMVTGFGLALSIGVVHAVVWTVFALASYLALIGLAGRFVTTSVRKEAVQRWANHFLVVHAAAGLCWAYFASLSCSSCQPLRFEIFQFAVLIVAVASTAMVSFTLRAALPVAFGPMVAVLAYGMVSDPNATRIAMSGVLACAVPFFILVSELLRRTTLTSFIHQAEKDELIVELETARAISDEARRRAEEANRAKSQFLATMSHELRTPLNAILGFSEVMSNEMLGPLGSPSYREYVDDIHASGQHLLGLINEILDLSRIEAGRYALNEEAVELVSIARDCLAIVRIRAEKKELQLEGRFEQDLPALWADERAVRQIILNLLSNAVKFTPFKGSIVLSVGWTAGGGQYVSVRDDGPGIPKEEIPLVLSSFGQGSTAIKSAEQGTGLGLPIVQALVKLHNGDFRLISKLRQGTEAIATFPQSRVLEVMPAFDETSELA